MLETHGKAEGLVDALKTKAAQVLGDILEWKSEKNASEGGKLPQADFSGTFPEEVTDAWSMSEYLLKEAFRRGLKPPPIPSRPPGGS